MWSGWAHSLPLFFCLFAFLIFLPLKSAECGSCQIPRSGWWHLAGWFYTPIPNPAFPQTTNELSSIKIPFLSSDFFIDKVVVRCGLCQVVQASWLYTLPSAFPASLSTNQPTKKHQCTERPPKSSRRWILRHSIHLKEGSSWRLTSRLFHSIYQYMACQGRVS